MITSALGNDLIDETAGGKFHTAGKSVGLDVFFENWPHLGQIKSSSLEMRIGQCHLRDQITLGGSDIDGSVIFAPRELACDCQVGAAAHSRHGFQELFQPGRIGVEGHERVGAAIFDFVLRKSSSEGGGEMAPKGIEPVVGHFQNAANVGRLALV